MGRKDLMAPWDPLPPSPPAVPMGRKAPKDRTDRLAPMARHPPAARWGQKDQTDPPGQSAPGRLRSPHRTMPPQSRHKGAGRPRHSRPPPDPLPAAREGSPPDRRNWRCAGPRPAARWGRKARKVRLVRKVLPARLAPMVRTARFPLAALAVPSGQRVLLAPQVPACLDV